MRKLKNEELKRLTPEEYEQTLKIPVVLVLDDIRSAYNVGSVFRTADAFLVEAIYLCGITACPPHREIQKTALGANETVSWKYFKNPEEAIARLKNSGYKISVIEQAENRILLNEFQPSKNEKLAIVFGNEVGGVSQKIMDAADVCIEVPQFGTKHSLNIAVCAGIVVWEIFKKIQTVSESKSAVIFLFLIGL